MAEDPRLADAQRRLHELVENFDWPDDYTDNRRSTLTHIWHGLIEGEPLGDIYRSDPRKRSERSLQDYYWKWRNADDLVLGMDMRLREFSASLRHSRGTTAGGLLAVKEWRGGDPLPLSSLIGSYDPLVFDPDRERPPRPDFATFRRDFLGRPTLRHQEAMVRALEDPTNLYVFIFAPTGAGKDTIAGDYVLWEVADPEVRDKKIAWFMESEEFSRRRLGRITQYLTDPQVYRNPPPKTPGASTPIRSMISDYGPFKWEKGMTTPDGAEVNRPPWTAHTCYFLSGEARDADPNLWATGVGGATYGSRIDVAVCSDMFTLENQLSPTLRETQFSYVESTLDTRLDEDGRLVVIGTMLPMEHNYPRLLAHFTDGATLIESDAFYEKWSNGVAVVRIPAIQMDENGNEVSYWPEKFPLDDMLEIDGERRVLADVDADEYRELLAQHRNGSIKSLRTIRGLRSRRRRNPVHFRAMMMQEDVTSEVGDFTEPVLASADDRERSFGRWHPHETLVLGVDPARSAGAAYAVIAIDRREKTLSLVDYDYGERLGTTGIKNRLLVNPITTYMPAWVAYEVNRESAVLDDPTIQDLFREYGVRVHTHTTGRNRAHAEVGVGALANLMRTGVLRFPAATSEDRRRMDMVRTHFKSWDSSTLAGKRSRSGQRGHAPDDIALAIWIAVTKAYELLDKKKVVDQIGRAVPEAVSRKWKRYQAEHAKSQRRDLSQDPASARDLATLYVTTYNEAQG